MMLWEATKISARFLHGVVGSLSPRCPVEGISVNVAAAMGLYSFLVVCLEWFGGVGVVFACVWFPY